MFNIIEFYTGVTNLTICLPVTLTKAWHLSRTRKFEVQKHHKIIKNNLLKNSRKDEENEPDESVVELSLDENPALVHATAKQMLIIEKEKPLQTLINDYECMIDQKDIESKKVFLTSEKSDTTKAVKNTSSPPLWNHSAEGDITENYKRLSVADRVRDIETQYGSIDSIPKVVPQTEKKSPRELIGERVLPQFKISRQPSTKTKEELRELKALLKLQSKMVSSSTDRLNKIENNFEAVSFINE